MFEVTNVKYVSLSKQVELTALDDMRGTEIVFGIGSLKGADPQPRSCPYDFPKGSTVTLSFVVWKKFSLGDRVDLSTMLKYDSMQQLLLRNAGY